MDGGLRSDCLPHHWSLLFGFPLWPPVSIGDKSHSHKNLMKRLGKGARARAHRLKACVKFGEGQVMLDIHSYHFKTPAEIYWEKNEKLGKEEMEVDFSW